MNKKIKLSLLGTLIAGSALAVTLPIVSCSTSADVVLMYDYNAKTVLTTMIKYVAVFDTAAKQQTVLTKGYKITIGTSFAALVDAFTFFERDTIAMPLSTDVIESFEVTTGVRVTSGLKIPGGTVLTVNLKGGYTTDSALTIGLPSLGYAK